MKNVASSGAKWVDVSAERFPGWIEGFAVRHGGPATVTSATVTSASVPAPGGGVPGGGAVTFTAPDGTVAECHPPYSESFVLPAGDAGPAEDTGPPGDARLAGEAARAIAAHAATPRTVGVLLVRLGGYAVGVFIGYPPVLRDAKVGSRPVHGRSAAGGWSQHRFARRREKQANEALEAAANAAVRIFGGPMPGGPAPGRPAPGRPAPGRPAPGSSVGERPAFDAVVLGGDKRAVAELRDDARLAPYFALATARFLTVPDPKRAVLEASPKQFTAVHIRITEPDS